MAGLLGVKVPYLMPNRDKVMPIRVNSCFTTFLATYFKSIDMLWLILYTRWQKIWPIKSSMTSLILFHTFSLWSQYQSYTYDIPFKGQAEPYNLSEPIDFPKLDFLWSRSSV